MEHLTNNLEEIFQKVKEYAEVRFDLFRLKAISKLAGFMSYIVTTLFFMVFFGAILLCITLGAALWLGELFGKTYLGFFGVAGIYLVIAIILYIKRETLIRKPMSDRLIKELSEEDIL
jgi:ABC-type uncharacterized transport system fused permease/ATPase subunit